MNFLNDYKPITMYESIYKEFLDKRILYINDEISDVSVDMIATPINLLNEEEKYIPESELRPLWLYINSPGGDINACLHIIEIIKNSRIPIYAKVLSMAASAGLYIVIACHKRFAHKYSVLLLHKGSMQFSGSSGEAEDFVDFYKEQVGKIFDDLIIERTKITPEDLKKIRRNETYVLGEEALKLGFIDEIL